MENQGKFLLRLTVGGMLILHGIKKLDTGIEWIEQTLAAKDLPEFLAYGVYLGELLAPALLIVGFFTRLSALAVAGNMAFAVYLVHSDDVLKLNDYGAWAIELPALFFFGALCIAMLGAGSLSIDGRKKIGPPV